MKVITCHWTQHPLKAYGAYTDAHGPIDPAKVQIAEGLHDGSKVLSPWYAAECTRRAGNPAAVAQELDIAYLSSGFPVFAPEWSRAHLERVQAPVRRVQPVIDSSGAVPSVTYEERQDGELCWFGDLDPSRVYCAGVDTAEGLGDKDSDPDYSSIVIWDPVNGRPVACYRSRVVSPADVAAIVSDLAERCILLITIERNGPGLAVISTLAGLLTGYTQEADVFYPLNYADVRGTSERQPGFRTTADSKHQLIELVRYHTDPCRGTLLDRRLVDEYTVFAHLSGRKMGAPVGAHDDMVMALGLALVAVKDAPTYEPDDSKPDSDDEVMATLASSVLSGALSDEQVFEQLGLR